MAIFERNELDSSTAGTIDLGTQEESAISKNPQETPESKLAAEDPQFPLDAPSATDGPGSPDLMAEIRGISGTGLPLKQSPSLKRVLRNISASLEDLQAVAQEADLPMPTW